MQAEVTLSDSAAASTLSATVVGVSAEADQPVLTLEFTEPAPQTPQSAAACRARIILSSDPPYRLIT